MEKIFDITNTITNDPERKITFEPGETFHHIFWKEKKSDDISLDSWDTKILTESLSQSGDC